MPRKSSAPSTPDWALKINRLRQKLKLERAGFAALFGVSEMTVSNWLTGRKHPKPAILFRMAQMATTEEEAAPFLKLFAERAGADSAGITSMWGPQKKSVQSVKRADFGYVGGDAVAIPLLKDAAAAGQPRQINEKEIAESLPLPRSLCPHPESIVCIRVEGDSMSPFLEAGYIAAIDTSLRERRRLYGRMVAARDPEGGVTIKWLRKTGKDELLLSQRTSPRHQPVILTRDGEEGGGWAIIGEVIWWIGMPPK